MRMKKKTSLVLPCEKKQRETSKVFFCLFVLLIEVKSLGTPQGKIIPGFWFFLPFLSAIELSNWKNTSFCSLLVLPPVLTAELNVLGFLWCEQDLPLGKVGGGLKKE